MIQPRANRIHVLTVILALAAFLVAGPVATVSAAPGPVPAAAPASGQTPGWLSEGSASLLDVGIPALVPSWLPSPFGGEPSISAWDGYYSLYWMVPGAPPTYLRVTGEAGGAIPDYSAYDRNVQLVQNATVMGYPAWHDLTPIYDLVYWQVGNVVYSVDGHNIGDDSLTIANNLTQLSFSGGGADSGGGGGDSWPDAYIDSPAEVTSGGTALVSVANVGDAYLTVDTGYFSYSGDVGISISGQDTVEWVIPETSTDLVAYFTVSDLNTGTILATSQTTIIGSGDGEITTALTCPEKVTIGREARLLLTGTGEVTLTLSEGTWPDEVENQEFGLTEADASWMTGTASPDGKSVRMLAPDYETYVTVTATDVYGEEVDTCEVRIVTEEVDGDIEGPEVSGDGSGISGDHTEAVSRVIANPIGFAGDGSGGSKANAVDYSEISENRDLTPAPTATSADGAGATDADSPVGQLSQSTGDGGLVARTMGVAGGTLTSSNGISLTAPQGALPDQTTITIRPVSDGQLGAQPAIEVVPESGFEITVASADGQAVTEFQAPLQLAVSLPGGAGAENAKLYRLDGATPVEVETTVTGPSTLAASIDTFGRFFVGVPEGAAAATTGGTDFTRLLVAAGAIMAASMAVMMLSRAATRGRTRSVAPRRVAPTRVRYR